MNVPPINTAAVGRITIDNINASICTTENTTVGSVWIDGQRIDFGKPEYSTDSDG